MRYFEWRGEKISQMVLGTAQLGMNYGIANKTGQTDECEAIAILSSALDQGINMIDTAQGYGNSELVIGKWLASNTPARNHVQVISKLNLSNEELNTKQFQERVMVSTKNIGGSLWGMMLHSEELLNELDKIQDQVYLCKKEGLFNYFGVSIYTVEAAKKAIEMEDIDFIQVPSNAWDSRMVKEGVFDLAEKRDKLCFIRSVFLQGLLLMPASEAKKKLPASYEVAKEWESYATEKKSSKTQLAFEYVSQFERPLVVGVDNVMQLKNNMDTFISNRYNTIHKENFSPDKMPEIVVSPQLWSC